MIGIIVAGHGNFASGITSMLELVVGKPENYEYIDFLQGESQEALEDDYREKLVAAEHGLRRYGRHHPHHHDDPRSLLVPVSARLGEHPAP